MKMINRGADTFIFLLVLLEMKFLDAQVANKSSNQGDEITSVESRFFDRGGRGMGYPNFQKPINYPANSFLPNNNQNVNMQRPQQDFGWRPDVQYPETGQPYQEQGRYPGNYLSNRPENYPDRYPGRQGDMPYPPNSNNYSPNDYNGQFRPGVNNMNQNQNYQRPAYQDMPGNDIEYTGYTNGPYQNGGRNLQQGDYSSRPGISGDSRPSGGYSTYNGQYPPQGNFQGNPNQPSPGFRPDYPDDVLDSTVKFPETSIRPNQYPPNNNHHSNYPNDPIGNQISYPSDVNQDQVNYNPGSNQVFQGNFNSLPTTKPQLPNNRPIDSINGPNANESTDIPGKPVSVSSSNPPKSQIMFDSSTERISQKQCELNCPTTSEYNPLCGTNNVTYENPGRFECARNCGVAVNPVHAGRCLNDVVRN